MGKIEAKQGKRGKLVAHVAKSINIRDEIEKKGRSGEKWPKQRKRARNREIDKTKTGMATNSENIKQLRKWTRNGENRGSAENRDKIEKKIIGRGNAENSENATNTARRGNIELYRNRENGEMGNRKQGIGKIENGKSRKCRTQGNRENRQNGPHRENRETQRQIDIKEKTRE